MPSNVGDNSPSPEERRLLEAVKGLPDATVDALGIIALGIQAGTYRILPGRDPSVIRVPSSPPASVRLPRPRRNFPQLWEVLARAKPSSWRATMTMAAGALWAIIAIFGGVGIGFWVCSAITVLSLLVTFRLQNVLAYVGAGFALTTLVLYSLAVYTRATVVCIMGVLLVAAGYAVWTMMRSP